ncbi:MAG: PTS galactosamine/N-acetylgalactosamine transporter subunit IIA [Erysipelotrichaceae bacterium]
MIGIIVTGHGNFGSGLTSSLRLIGGEPKDYQFVDFLSDYSVEDLERELTKAIEALKDCDGILVLSDLAGGSPFKTSVELSMKHEKINVIGGTNLPMLIEVNMARTFMDDMEALTQMAINTGKDQVVQYVFKPVEQYEDMEDGI